MKLYIIGNGFDNGAHNLESGYNNFKEYVCVIKPLIFKILTDAEDRYNKNNAKNKSKNWCYFEKILEYINIEKIIGTVNQAKHTDEIKKNYKEVLSDLLNKRNKYKYAVEKIDELFHQWVNDLEKIIDSKKQTWLYSNPHLIGDNSKQFLNFNYTSTLEKFYKIHNVNHIHIKKDINSKSYIYGYEKPNNKKYGNRSTSNFSTINKPFEDGDLFAKNVCEIIENGVVDYENIKEIYFWGFSLSDVDKPYIEKIFKDNKDTIEKVFLCKHQFEKNDREHYYNFLKDYDLENKFESFDDELNNR